MIPRQIALIIPRLASDHVGELVAARDAIGRALKASGLDWHDLAAACAAPAPPTTSYAAPNQPRGRAPAFGDMARGCRDLDRGRLSPRERSFVGEMCAKGFGFRPSPRQARWIADILDRLQGRAAA